VLCNTKQVAIDFLVLVGWADKAAKTNTCIQSKLAVLCIPAKPKSNTPPYLRLRVFVAAAAAGVTSISSAGAADAAAAATTGAAGTVRSRAFFCA
jgi:hypothetical protein